MNKKAKAAALATPAPSKVDPFLPFLLIILGLALRVYAAVSHLDISHQDEHFQTLEPASHVVFGFGWLSWEWTQGIRSWVVPGLYIPLLWIFKILGFSGGPVPIAGCRVLMAFVSSFGVYRFWILLQESGFRRLSCWITLAILALSPAFAAWGAMTLSDVWAWVFLWSVLPYVLRVLQEKHPGRRAFIAGLLLGLSFLIRIQMVLWPIGIGLLLLFRRPLPLRLIFKLIVGYWVAVLFQGALDWITWGEPFQSIIMNVQKNLFENVASFYGTAPAYEYLRLVPMAMGWPICLITFVCFFVALFQFHGRLGERDRFILLPALLYFCVHSAIAHKELRFMFPVFPAILYLLAWSLSVFEGKFKEPEIRKSWAASLALIIAVISSGFVYSTDHTYPFDLAELTLKIREDGGLANGGCLLLVDHYWVWTRGEMMIGAPVSFIELPSNQHITPAASQCAYAIAPQGREAWFNQLEGPKWELIARDNHGQFLMKRILTRS